MWRRSANNCCRRNSACKRNCAANTAAARLDALDASLLGIAVFDGAKHDAVAGGHDVALIGGQGFQQASGGALINRAALVLDHADQAEHAQHAAVAADACVHVEMNVKAGLFMGADLLATDGAMADEVSLSADPLTLQRGLVLESMLAILPRPVGSPDSDAPVLAKLSADFLLLSHPRPDHS